MRPLELALEKQGRKLPRAECERLAQRLLERLEEERLTTVDRAWVAEAERRLSVWKGKKTKPVVAAKVIADIHKKFRRQRS